MHKLTKTLVAAALVAATLAAGGAYAFPHDRGCARGAPHWPGGLDGRMERLADRLNLSPDQLTAIRAIVDKARPSARALLDGLRDTRRQLRALETAAAPNDTELRKLADAQGKAIAGLIVLKTKTRAEIRAVLTDEQRQRLGTWHPRFAPRAARGGLDPTASLATVPTQRSVVAR